MPQGTSQCNGWKRWCDGELEASAQGYVVVRLMRHHARHLKVAAIVAVVNPLADVWVAGPLLPPWLLVTGHQCNAKADTLGHTDRILERIEQLDVAHRRLARLCLRQSAAGDDSLVECRRSWEQFQDAG